MLNMSSLFEIVIKDVCSIKSAPAASTNEVEEATLDYLNIIMFGFWL